MEQSATNKTLTRATADQVQMLALTNSTYKEITIALDNGTLHPIGWCMNALKNAPRNCRLYLVRLENGDLFWIIPMVDDLKYGVSCGQLFIG